MTALLGCDSRIPSKEKASGAGGAALGLITGTAVVPDTAPRQVHAPVGGAMPLGAPAASEAAGALTLPEARAKLADAEKARADGKPKLAQDAYVEAITAYKKLENASGMANALLGLGTLQRKQGRPNKARVAYGEAGTLFRQSKSKVGEALAFRGLAELDLDDKKPRLARNKFAKAGALFSAAREHRREAAVTLSIAALDREEGRKAQAEAAYRHAAELYKLLKMPEKERQATKAAIAVSPMPTK